jgi:hypothetical protein
MSYPKKTAKLRPLGGVARDMPASEVGPNYYTFAENVQFRKGFAGRVLGSRAAYDPPSVPPLGLANVIINGVNYWVYVSDSAQYVVETATHSNITLLAGLSAQAAASQHSLPLLNNVVIHNNALDAPMYWPGDPGLRFLELPDWPAGSVARCMVAHRYHLFALHLDESGGVFPAKVMWSDAAAPGTVPASWTPSASTQAGDTELADTPGAVVTGATLRDTLLLYKRSSVYQADYVGGNEIYAFRSLFRGVGALNEKSVAPTERGHVVVTDGDVVLVDGLNVQPIAYGRIRSTLFSQLAQDNLDALFTVYNRARREVWIAFPESGSDHCSRAMVYNLDADAWSERVLDEVASASVGVVSDTSPSEAWDPDAGTWDTESTLWNADTFSRQEILVTCSEPQNEFRLPDSGDVETFGAIVGKHDMHFDAPERLKYVRRLHLRKSDNSGALLVRAGARMSPDESTTWGAEQTVAPGQQVVNLSALGRYISVEIRSAGSDVWEVSGFDIEYELRGYH